MNAIWVLQQSTRHDFESSHEGSTYLTGIRTPHLDETRHKFERQNWIAISVYFSASKTLDREQRLSHAKTYQEVICPKTALSNHLESRTKASSRHVKLPNNNTLLSNLNVSTHQPLDFQRSVLPKQKTKASKPCNRKRQVTEC